MQEDASFDEVATSANELHPKILAKGDIQDLNDKAVVAEKMVICTLQGMLLNAVVVYMAVNYVLLFEYLIEFNHFCLFLQECVLHIHDGQKLSSSFLDFINKLDTLATSSC